MKIEVLQENFVKALSLVSRFVPSKPSMPILSNVKLKTEKGDLVLIANNMESSVEVLVAAKIVEEGSCVVPAKVLTEFVGLIKPGKMIVSKDESALNVKNDSHQADFALVDDSEYPELPEHESVSSFQLKASVLEKIVKQVLFATSKDDARPVLSAVLLIFGKKSFKAVATDGYRLSMLDTLKIQGSLGEEKLLVPSKVLVELERLLKEVGGTEVTVQYSKKQKSLTFGLGKITIISRLVEGDFPPFERIIPKESEMTVECDREDLLESIKVAQVFARESSQIIKWEFVENGLYLASNTVNVGHQRSIVNAKIEGTSVKKIAFNGRFLLELMNSLDSSKVKIQLTGPLQPGLFESEEKGFLHVIMPVRTQDTSED